YSAFENVAVTRNWSLPAGQGEKTVYMKLKDGGGTVYGPFIDEITMDTVTPSGSVIVNGGDLYTNDTKVQLHLQATDSSGIEAMQFSNDGGTYSSWENYWASKTWILASGNGTKTVYVKYRDNAGNVSSAKTDTILLDQAVPSACSIVINGGDARTADRSVTLTLSTSDPSGIVQMRFRNDNTGPYSRPEAYTSSRVWNLRDKEGTNSVQVQFQDGAGNWSADFTDDIILDKSIPAGTILVNSNAVYTNTLSVNLSLSASDPAGTDKMILSNNNFAWTQPENYATSKSWSLDQSGDGGFAHVLIQLRDKLGFVTSADALIFLKTSGGGGGALRTVSVEIEDGSGHVVSTTDSIKFFPDGEKTVYVRYADTLGNWSISAWDAITLDRTRPTGDLTINDGAARTKDVNVVLKTFYEDNYEIDKMQFSNDGSNWSALEPVADSKNWTIPGGSSNRTVYVRYTDKAGNYSESITDNIILDQNSPAGTIVVNNNEQYTNDKIVSLRITSTDPAGVAGMSFSNDYNGPFSPWESFRTHKTWDHTSATYGGNSAYEGPKAVYVRFKDNLGNFQGHAYTGDWFNYDKTIPTDAYCYINNNSARTANRRVTLNISASDHSGVIRMRFRNDNTGPYSKPEPYATSRVWDLMDTEGVRSVQFQFQDGAGNWSNDFSDSIILDKTGAESTIVINGDAVYTNSSDVTLNLTSSDPAGTGKMSFSNNNSSWTAAETYATSKSWSMGTSGTAGFRTIYIELRDTFGYVTNAVGDSIFLHKPGGGDFNLRTVTIEVEDRTGHKRIANDSIKYITDGKHVIFAKFSDSLGNWSSSVHDSIIMDRTKPTGYLLIDQGYGTTQTTSVKLHPRFTDNYELDKMQFSNDGTNWSGLEAVAPTKSWTLTSGAGVKTVYTRFTDKAGNISLPATQTITLQDPPVGILAINSGRNYTNSTSVVLSLTATGQAFMQFSNDGTNYSTFEAFNATKNWTLPSGEGNKTVYARFKDGGGSVSVAISDQIYLDTGKPTGTIIVNDGALYTNDPAVHLSLTCSDSNGVEDMQFSNNGSTWSSWQDYWASKTWTLAAGDGTKTVYVRFRDNAGNISNNYTDTILFDQTPPSVCSLIIDNGAAVTRDTAVDLKLTASDPSGIVQMRFRNDNRYAYSKPEAFKSSKSWGMLDKEGTNSVQVQFLDGAGNWSNDFSDDIILDKTGPTGSVVVDSNAVYTNSLDVSLTLSASDPSGMGKMVISNNNATWSNPENYATSKAWTLDMSGNSGFREVWIELRDIYGQVSSAKTNIFLEGGSPSGGGAVRIVFVEVEDLAGHMVTTYDTIKFMQDGYKTVYTRFSDALGNWSQSVKDEIILDRTVPTGSLTINDGDDSTGSVNVVLKPHYEDNYEVDKMQFSNDNSNWTALETAANSKNWTLSAGAGTKTVYVRYTDKAGNLSDSIADTIVLDTAPPTGSIVINDGETFTSDTRVILRISATDPAGVEGMQFSNDGSNWSDFEVFNTGKTWDTASATYGGTGGDGTKTVYVRFRDNMGNIGNIANDNIILDKTPPSTGAILINSGAARTTERRVTLTISSSDSSSGVVRMRFRNDNTGPYSKPEPYATSRVWDMLDKEGTNSVQVQFQDKAGNWTADYSDSILLDNSGAEGTVIINANAVYTNQLAVNLTLSATDPAGVSKMIVSNNNSSWTEPENYATSKSWNLGQRGTTGFKNVYVQFRDIFGNVSETNDVATILLTGSGGGGGYYRTVYVEIEDSSGWKLSTSDSIKFMPDGVKNVYATFSDSLGNWWSSSANDSIILDRSKPTGSLTINERDVSTNNRNVVLRPLFKDNYELDKMQFRNSGGSWSALEPVAHIKNWTLSAGAGTKTVYVRYTDKAGNLSDLFSDQIILDLAPPTGSVVINGGDVWTNSTKVFLQISATDPSGVHSMQIRNSLGSWSGWESYKTVKAWTIPTGDGNGNQNSDDTKHVQVRFKDNLGNVSDIKSDSIKLDQTAPTGSIRINNNAARTRAAQVTLNLSTVEYGSGMAQMRFRNDNNGAYSQPEPYSSTKIWKLLFTEGTRSVQVQFKDNAGNWSADFSDNIILDKTGPWATLNINSNAKYTNDINVNLALSANDPSALAQMRFSNNDVGWADPENYATSKTWSLAKAGYGRFSEGRRVYMQVRDKFGEVTSVDSVIFIAGPGAGGGEFRTVFVEFRNATGQISAATDSVRFMPDGFRTVYGRVSDNLGNWSPSFSDEIILDRTLPTGSLVINRGWERANTYNVSLNPAWADNYEIDKMKFSNDNVNWSALQPVAASVPWVLSNGNGIKTVYVRFTDKAGNVSLSYSDTIELDLYSSADMPPDLLVFDETAPTGSILINGGAKYTRISDVSLAMVASDPAGLNKMRLSNNSSSWTEEEDYATSRSWKLTETGSGGLRTVTMEVEDSLGKRAIANDDIFFMNDGYKTVYIRFSDIYHNWSGAYYDSIILDRTKPTGSISINSDDYSTKELDVVLNPHYEDNYEVDKMQFSNDNYSWTAWKIATTTYSWRLPAGAGVKTVYVRYLDKIGNMSETYSDSIVLDQTGPVASIVINKGATYCNQTLVSLSVASSDQSGVEAMQFSNDGNSYSSFEPFTGSKTWTITSGDGNKSVYVRFRDNAGNIGSPAIDNIVLDQTSPTTGGILINQGNSRTGDHWVSLAISASDPSGIVQMRFRNKNSTVYSKPVPYTTSKSWTLPRKDGIQGIYVQFQDGAGNWSADFSDDIILDINGPTGTVSINSDAKYTNSLSVNLGLSASDPGNVYKMTFSNTSVSWSPLETYGTSKVWRLDRSGTGGVKNVVLQLRDKVGQITTINDSIFLSTSHDGPSLLAKSVTVQVEDLVGLISESTDSIAYNVDGERTVYVSYIDVPGNWCNPVTDKIILDRTAPVGSIDINSGAFSTNDPDVVLTPSYKDNYEMDKMQFSNDGVNWSNLVPVATSYNWTLSGGEATKTVYARYTDKAGNVSKTLTDQIFLDLSAPQASIKINGGDAYARETLVSILITADDPSGIKDVQFSNDGNNYSAFQPFVSSKTWVLTSGDGNKTVYMRFRDNLGNLGSASTDSIILDTTPPDTGSIVINNNAERVAIRNVNLALTASDALSGIVQMRFKNRDSSKYSKPQPYNTSKIWELLDLEGTRVVLVQFKDGAGNWSQNFVDNIILDKSGPEGMVSINANAVYTNSMSVTLTVAATDPGGVNKMIFSNTNASWSPPEAYAVSKVWRLDKSGTGGMKNVEVQFRDSFGATTTVSDSIFMASSASGGDISQRTVMMQVEDGAGHLVMTTDSIAFNPDGHRTVYTRFSDNLDNWSKSYSDVIILDRTEPVGSVIINSGVYSTNSQNVTLDLSYYDNYEMDKMQFSNDNVNWSTLEAVATSKSWTLSAGDAKKTVYVRYTDKAGNLSPSFSDTIWLETVPPEGTIVINNGAVFTNDRKVTLTISATDNSGVDAMAFSTDGSNYSAFEDYKTTKTWTLAAGEHKQTVWVRFRDNLGNYGNPTSDSIILREAGGYVIINNRDTHTADTVVTLSLLSPYYDVRKMSFRNGTEAVFSPPEDFVATKTWTMTDTGGTRTVVAKFQNGAGDWSAEFEDTIILDKSGPTGTISINSGATYTNISNVTLNLSASDPVGPKNMLFSNDSSAWTLPEKYSTSKSWSLGVSGNSEFKRVEVQVRDFFGNVSDIGGDNILLGAGSTGGGNYRTVFMELEDGSGLISNTSDSIRYLGDGPHYVYVKYSDTLDNWAKPVYDSIILDRTVPQGTIDINSGAPRTNSRTVTLSVFFTDNYEVDKMQFSNDNSNWSAFEPAKATKTWTITAGEGTKTVYTRFIDKAGNISISFYDSIIYELSAPGGTVVINQGDALTNQTLVRLLLTADDPAGVDSVAFSNDGSSYSAFEPYTSSKTWTLTSGDGLKTVYVRFRDNLGNYSFAASDGITLDQTPPTVGSIVINGGNARVSTAEVTLTLSASDPSGVVKMRFRNKDALAYSTPEAYSTAKIWHLLDIEGTRQVLVQFCDTVGNWSSAFADDIILDKSGPTGTVVIDADAIYTNSMRVNLALTATDPDGVNKMTFSNSNSGWSFPEAYATSKSWRLDISGAGGVQKVALQVRDHIGNITTVYDSIFFDGSSEVGKGGDLNFKTVTAQVEDGSGHRISFSDSIRFMPDGEFTVYARYVDNLGNWSKSSTDKILLDRTPPIGSLDINSGALRTSDVNVVLTPFYKDNFAIDKMQFSDDKVNWSALEPVATSKNWTLPAGAGGKTVYVRYTDKIGNISDIYSDAIMLDIAAPLGSIVINNGEAFTNSREVLLTIAVADDAGVSGMSFSNDGSNYTAFEEYKASKTWQLATGETVQTVWVRFKDNLGNVGNPAQDSIMLREAGGYLIVNNYDARTATTTVNLTLLSPYMDTRQMRFRNGNSSVWSAPEVYKLSKTWNLLDIEGTRTAVVKFQNGKGIWSGEYSDTIFLDKSTPIGSVSINSGDVYTNSVDVAL
ncbi:hypothetical protein ACFL35_15320, partial [Candidatus Riflebacteria bacterium]